MFWTISSLLKRIVLSLIVSIYFQASTHAGEYRIAHCLMGCPLGSDLDSQLILRPIYALSFNTITKTADWVAYKVSSATIGIASSLSRQPKADDFITETLREAEFAGAEQVGLVLSRYVPLVNFAATPYWGDANFLTNIVARTNNLNQGAWYGLEWSIRNLANRENEVFVLTGPVYKSEQQTQQLPITKQHRVPDAFFKIVMTENGRAAAFLLDQQTPVYVHHCDLRVSIEEIEAQTGLTFFPDAPQLSLTPLDSSLGCSR